MRRIGDPSLVVVAAALVTATVVAATLGAMTASVVATVVVVGATIPGTGFDLIDVRAKAVLILTLERGPKYPSEGEMPATLCHSPRAVRVREPK
jgi:hypothetical protein